jgi:predicted acyltransferase (DUF342 family)
MLDDALVLLLILLFVLMGFVFVLFIPSLWEIRKPRDKGPRRVNDATLKKLGVKVRRLNGDFVRLLGDLSLPDGFEFEENVMVEGYLHIGNRCHFGKSVKVLGDVVVGCGVVIDENLVVEGKVNVLDEAVIGGSVDARGDVRLGEKVFVGGAVASGGDIELFENCEVVGGVMAGEQGAVKVLKMPRVEFPSTIEDVG